jgi:hypothetical protein
MLRLLGAPDLLPVLPHGTEEPRQLRLPVSLLLMVRNLEQRVGRLEESVGVGGECPRCGGSDNDNCTYEIIFCDPDDPGEDKEEFCSECGRQLICA